MHTKSSHTKEELLKKISHLESRVSELEKSKLQNSTWLKNSPVCTKIIDLDYNLQFMSNSGIRDLKIDDITEFYGKPYPFPFYPDSFKIPMTKNLRKVKETGETIIQEAPIVDIKGNTIWYHSTIIPVNNNEGQLDYLMVVSVETTASKRSKEALKKQNEEYELLNTELKITNKELVFAKNKAEENHKLYEDLVQSSHNLIWKCDVEGKFTFLNSAWENTHGYKVEEMLGRPFSDFQRSEVFERDIIEFTKHLDGGFVKGYETTHLRKDGTEIHLIFNALPLFNSSGKIIGTQGTAFDISKLNLTEQINKENEVKYRTMIETSNDMIWMLDNNGNFTFMNKQAEKATGFLTNDLMGKSFEPVVMEEELPFLKEVLIKTISGESLTYEMKLKTVFDTILILSVNTAPIYSGDKISGIFSFARDISRQKEIELSLKESEKRFKALHNASFGGIAIHDIGIIKDCNQGLSNITGYSIEELIGMDGLLCIAKDSRKIVKQNILSSYEKAYEVVGLRKNGEEFPLRLEGKMIPYEGKKLRAVEFRDITEQKKAEDNIRKLSTAVKQSPSIVVITDTRGELEYVNPIFTEITGYTSDESIGRESNILKSGEQDSAFYKEMWKTIESGKVWKGQFHNKKKNGELFWEAASISAILNESGDVVNFIKIGEDITQQKIIDVELKTALEKALESDRLKSAFLANMSHEIRTPMNGILGFVELLNEPNLSKSQIGEYTSIINKSGDRLLNTINDIIDISKIEAKEMTVSTTGTSINQEFEELFSFFSSEVKQKGLSLLIEPSLPAEPLIIQTDNHKLHGILTNLIKNAIKYTEQGYVKFGYQLKKYFIEFYVKDTGIGIPKNRLKAIFNRFEQADISDKLVFEGSGLGLAISKAYVEMLGGEISVDSDLGKGSKFTFTIPYIRKIKSNVEKLEENIETDSNKIKKLNLLIAEDDEVSTEFLKTSLESLFNKIIFAVNGKDAVEKCRNNPELDLVLMDIKMPKMNGYDATKEIRKFNKDLLIIAQTAYALHGDKEKAINAGCDDYISKPIDKKLLFDIINNLLNPK